MRKYILSLFTAGGFVLGGMPYQAWSQTEIGLTFKARAKLELCPEFVLGGYQFDVFYSIGDDPALIDATLISSDVDQTANVATVVLELPSTLTSVPMHVAARCRKASLDSDVSNTLSINNCDHLALLDTDQDGIPNDEEDINCDNFFSPGDISNPDNVDSDGDGVRDLVERIQGFDPTNPGSSPRPFVYTSSPFDPDQDGTSNPTVWRPSSGFWFIRDYLEEGNHLAFQFGLPGDIPFFYETKDAGQDVGVIRADGLNLNWFFNGAGLAREDGSRANLLAFGIFGDNIILGPWEEPGVTNPAVARLFENSWGFDILLSDGSHRIVNWGGNGDIPKVQDYDGDGLFDIAVWRPSEQMLYVIHSNDGSVAIYKFGTGTADHTVRGDYTGDGIDDIVFWEPIDGMFSAMTSDNGFEQDKATLKDPDHFFEMQLGLFNIHLPLSWNLRNGKSTYTVVDHASGLRFFRENNDPKAPIKSLQWGIPGDSQS